MSDKSSFGIKDQVGYVFGDLAGSLITLYVDMYLLTFSTYVLGIDAKWMAGLFLVAKIWDAINDPLIGSLPDRFRLGKSGDKFKPYIKIAMLPLALAVIMLFSDTSSWSMLMKQIWIALGYMLYDISYTGTSMPYGAMSSVMTREPMERAKLSRARSLGATVVGVFFLPLVPTFIWNADRSPNVQGFQFIAIGAAVLSLICYTVLLKFATERYSYPNEKEINKVSVSEKTKYSFWSVLKDCLRNRPLLGVMIASLGASISSASKGAMGSYLYREFYNDPRLMALSGPIGIPTLLIAFFVLPKLVKKIGKRKLLVIGMIYNLVCSVGLFLFPIKNAILYMIISSIATLGQTVFMMLVWAFVTECIDYQEYKTGRRSDGTVYSIYTFSRKLASSITSSGVTYMLALIGFVSGVKVQADGVGENIRNMVTLMPAIAAVIQLFAMGIIFNISKEKSEQIYEELEKRRASEEV